jgi:hypothetical protein
VGSALSPSVLRMTLPIIANQSGFSPSACDGLEQSHPRYGKSNQSNLAFTANKIRANSKSTANQIKANPTTTANRIKQTRTGQVPETITRLENLKV